MEKVRFTRSVREKLRDLGWQKHFACNVDVVKTGEGKYSKQFGKVWITIMISMHYIQRIQSSIFCQTSDLDFAESLSKDFAEGIEELKSLKFFNE